MSASVNQSKTPTDANTPTATMKTNDDSLDGCVSVFGCSLSALKHLLDPNFIEAMDNRKPSKESPTPAVIDEDGSHWPSPTQGGGYFRYLSSDDVPSLEEDETTKLIVDDQAKEIQPHLRMILQTVHDCFKDSGFSPGEIQGSKTGVYASLSLLPVQYTSDGKLPMENRSVMSDEGKASTAAKYISNHYDFDGPISVFGPEEDSPVVAPLRQAARDLKTGIVERALVIGTFSASGKKAYLSENNPTTADQSCSLTVIDCIFVGYGHGNNDITTIWNGGKSADGIEIVIPNPKATVMKEILRMMGISAPDPTDIEAHPPNNHGSTSMTHKAFDEKRLRYI